MQVEELREAVIERRRMRAGRRSKVRDEYIRPIVDAQASDLGALPEPGVACCYPGRQICCCAAAAAAIATAAGAQSGHRPPWLTCHLLVVRRAL